MKRKRSLVEDVQDYIIEKSLRPGDPMPTEATLCDELGVSRSSVREAMKTLATLDIVEVRHGHGTFVGNLSLAPLVSGLVFRSVLNTDQTFATLRDVVSMRVAIDLSVADQLCERSKGHPSPALRDLVTQMRQLSSRGEPFPEADGAFHRTLLSMTDNQLLNELGAAFWEIHTEVVPMLGLPPNKDIQQTVDAHDAILDALEAGDVEAYREAVLNHYAPLERAIAAVSGKASKRGVA